MPTPKLQITIRNSNASIDRLHTIHRESQTLEAKYQHFIAEVIMLRLFAIFEESVSEIAYKLVAGATYLNGNNPALYIQARTVSASRGLLISYGRIRPVQNLKWTKAKFIRESVQHVIPTSEKFLTWATAHGALINEMRIVRNALAHRTQSSRDEYKAAVRACYGANLNIQPGAFLTSTRRQTTNNLTRYIQSTKVILHDISLGT